MNVDVLVVGAGPTGLALGIDLARRDIAGLDDLAGKRVAIGVENSGTFLTASLILSLAGVEPADR